MSDEMEMVERLNEGADRLAEAIRRSQVATSNVSIPVALEDVRMAVEERFEQIQQLQELARASVKVILTEAMK